MSMFSEGVANRYDAMAKGAKNKWISELYAMTDFVNFGYWREDTSNVGKACENLMEELLELIPEKSGNILDVACGKGATTEYLLEFFRPSDVSGINISHEQLNICREKLPQCNFLLMDATQLEFDDRSFDNIICVEAAHHFDTREKFLREARRVLIDGGNLVMADGRFGRNAKYQPVANWTKDLGEYRRIYGNVGFHNLEIVDASEAVFGGFADHCRNFLQLKHQQGEIGPKQLALYMGYYHRFRPSFKNSQTYLLVKCTK